MSILLSAWRRETQLARQRLAADQLKVSPAAAAMHALGLRILEKVSSLQLLPTDDVA
jgi:hypothetical protein